MQIPFPAEAEGKVKGIVVTAAHRPEDGIVPPPDFVSRYFGPWNGIDEDPVTGLISFFCLLFLLCLVAPSDSHSFTLDTGSAQEALAPYWYGKRDQMKGREDSTSLIGFQAAPGRGGYVGVEPNFETQRVLLRGSAVTVLRGTFDLLS